MMEQVAGEGMTMLVATHEMGFARKVADRVVFLDQGKILEVGTPEEVFGRPRQERTRRFLEKILVCVPDGDASHDAVDDGRPMAEVGRICAWRRRVA